MGENTLSPEYVATCEVVTKALDSGDKFGGFISKVFGASIENAVGMMSDKLQFLKWERQTRMIERVNEYQKEKGLAEVRPIPPKFAIPMMENASLEEDDDLQDIWSKLIATTLDPKTSLGYTAAFIDVVKGLNSSDAKILELFYDCWSKIRTPPTSLSQEMNCTILDCDISMDNLVRAGCMKVAVIRGRRFGEPVQETNYLRDYALTPFGIAFIQACIK